MRYCCDGEVCLVDFFLDVLCRQVHAENWVQLEAQVYECVGFFEVRLDNFFFDFLPPHS